MNTRKLVSVAALSILTCVANAASAQQQDAPKQDAPKQEVPISDEARAHFNAGVNLLQDPDGARYAEAYRAFKAAYAASPSWKILGNLGIAAMKLERDGEALEAFRKYLSEGGAQIDPEEKAQFERDAQTLEAGLVRIKIESVPPGAMIIDERLPMAGGAVINRYGPLTGSTDLGIRAGRHRITSKLAGYKDSVWEFDAESRGNYNHVFQMEKEQAAVASTPVSTGSAAPVQRDSSRPIPTSVYVGLGATGLLAIGGVLAGTLASSKRSDFDDLNERVQTENDRERAQEMRDSGQRLNLVADVLFGGALVAGGITAVLFFTRPTEYGAASAPKAKQARNVKLTPSAGAQGGGFVLSGRF